MMQIIPLEPISQVFDVTLDGYQVRIEIFWLEDLQRWQANIQNVSLGYTVYGVALNVSIDLLAAAGQLDLQVLMLIDVTGDLTEATANSLGSDHILVYVDLATYIEAFFDSSVIIRQLFRVLTEEDQLKGGAFV